MTTSGRSITIATALTILAVVLLLSTGVVTAISEPSDLAHGNEPESHAVAEEMFPSYEENQSENGLQSELNTAQRVENYSSPDGEFTAADFETAGGADSEINASDLPCDEIDDSEYQYIWEEIYNTTDWHPPPCPDTGELSAANYPYLFSDLPAYDREYSPGEWNNSLPFLDREDGENINQMEGAMLAESVSDSKLQTISGIEYTYSTARVWNRHHAPRVDDSFVDNVNPTAFEQISESSELDESDWDAVQTGTLETSASILGVSPSTTFLRGDQSERLAEAVVSNRGPLQLQLYASHSGSFSVDDDNCDNEFGRNTRSCFVSVNASESTWEVSINGNPVDSGDFMGFDRDDVFTITIDESERDLNAESLEIELQVDIEGEERFIYDQRNVTIGTSRSFDDTVTHAQTINQYTQLGENNGETIYYRPIGEPGNEVGYFMMVDIPRYTTDILTPHARIDGTYETYNARMAPLNGSTLQFVQTYGVPTQTTPEIQDSGSTSVSIVDYHPFILERPNAVNDPDVRDSFPPNMCAWGHDNVDISPADDRRLDPRVDPMTSPQLTPTSEPDDFDSLVPHPALEPEVVHGENCGTGEETNWYYEPNRVAISVRGDSLDVDPGDSLNDRVAALPALYWGQYEDDAEVVQYDTEYLPPARPTNVNIEITDTEEVGDRLAVRYSVSAEDVASDTPEPLSTQNTPAEIIVEAVGTYEDPMNVDTRSDGTSGTETFVIDDVDEWDGVLEAELTGVGPFPRGFDNRTTEDLDTVYLSSSSRATTSTYQFSDGLAGWLYDFASFVVPPIVYLTVGLFAPFYIIYRGLRM